MNRTPTTRATTAVVALALVWVASTCAADDDAVVYVDDDVTASVSSTSIVIVPTDPPAPESGDGIDRPPIVIDRAFSPENAIAEVSGVGALATDPVTVDDAPADVASFDVFSDGSFVVRVRIVDEGAHTVCVGDACSRVFTRAPDADTPEEVEAKIAEARVIAAELFDGEAELPGWTIDVAGPLAGVGGSADAAERVVTIHANRGRTVDEFVITILHEWGHAVDAEWLDDDDRVAYRELRGFEPETEWRTAGTHTIATWSLQPGEDFAEAMVAVWTRGSDIDHEVRTSTPAGPPDAETLSAVAALTLDE